MPRILDITYSLQDIGSPIAIILKHFERHPEKQEWRIGVSGELGTGKTTLFQKFLSALSTGDSTLAGTPAEAKGQSPTYVYLKSYEGDRYCVWHVDAYRLAPKIWKEILSTWEEETGKRKYILWVEWYDLIADDVTDLSIQLSFTPDSITDQRQLCIKTPTGLV